ncbi:MAG: phosphatidylserine decarboxylase [Gammaproteobacteria bacterium]|nr:MAG: phosphatidylserine decarboxylase [Gammaproteobacteria bacterium]
MLYHFLSVIIFYLSRQKIWGINLIIKIYIKIYKVDMSIAKYQNISHYKTLNQFFTREIKKSARPIDNDNKSITSPVDGAISQFGVINNGTIIQAKNHNYQLSDLIANDSPEIKNFENGHFITIYLSPKDYHRIHMASDGIIQKMTHIPGKLFSVSAKTVNKTPNLFARNERLVCLFKNNDGFKFGQILVAAVNVSAIETTWAGLIKAQKNKQIKKTSYSKQPQIKKGDEMGRFNMGSTVILLFPEKIKFASNLKIGQDIQLGNKIAIKL